MYLKTYDVSDPESPQLLGKTLMIHSPDALEVRGEYAYICADEYLYILDVSNPSQPKIMSSKKYPPDNDAQDIAVSGDFVYVTCLGGKIRSIDISDPQFPREEGTYSAAGLSGRIEVHGNYAFVAGGANGLQVVDISDPAFAANPIIDSFSRATLLPISMYTVISSFFRFRGNGGFKNPRCIETG